MANARPRDQYPIQSQIIGHRGASGHAPENTHSAIRLAAELGCQWIEVDVTISRDQTAIIFHDETLDRCSNGHGFIALTPWTELSELDAGTWFGAQFADERILSLNQLLDIALEYDLKVNLEIKPVIGLELETIEASVKVIQQRTRLPDLLISSFSERCLLFAKDHISEIPRALNVEALPSDWQQRLESLEATGIHFAREFMDPESIKKISRQYGVSCYTVNAQQPAKQLFQLGVDAIFTDLPDLYLAPE